MKTHKDIASYGGDPNRLLVMGHSSGAQLAALICTDDPAKHRDFSHPVTKELFAFVTQALGR